VAPPAATPGRRRSRDDSGDSDLELWVAAARAGDTAAFGWIWSALSPRVSGYLRARGVSSVDDVTSEVFLAAFTSLVRFTGNAADFRSWLFTIAHHKSVDDRRRRTDDDEYTAESDPRASASAEAAALDGIVDHDVRALLAALTDEQREVLLLRTLADMSIEDVASATGRTPGAVKQLYHRAVAATRRASAAPGVWPPASSRFDPAAPLQPRAVHAAGPPGTAVTRAALTTMTEL
jgi:RNA polymerase sigma-70 factor (ECF subfamily)